MIRLFVPQPLAAGDAIALNPDQSHYLANVMRREAGDEVAVFNGVDGEWRCVVAHAGKKRVGVVPQDHTRAQETGPDLDLVVALVKRARLETIIEKAASMCGMSLSSGSSSSGQRLRPSRHAASTCACSSGGRATRAKPAPSRASRRSRKT